MLYTSSDVLTSQNTVPNSLKWAQLLKQLIVFVLLVATGWVGLYLFYSFPISPASIWPPVGIALAAVYLEGYEMWIPIALSQFVLQLLSPSNPPVLVSLVIITAYTAQPLLGGYILKRFDFNPSFSHIKDAVLITLIGFTLPLIASLSSAFIAVAVKHLPTAQFFTLWSRSWAAGVLSILILTPLCVSLLTKANPMLKRRGLLEKTFVCLSVAAVSYITFATTLPKQNVFLVLSALFLILLWAGVRTGPRIMILSLFIISMVGVTGTIIVNPGQLPLNEQLLADELFIALITPIFLTYATLVEERRVASILLSQNIERLEDALKKISESDQAKNDFLAILAHELRNPLASVLSNLEVVKMHLEGEGDTSVLKHADIAISHAGTITHLLDDLLDVSRISKRKFKLQRQRVELAPLLTHALETVQPMYDARSQILNISTPKEPVVLLADPLRLGQVLVNLLTNASKFSHKRGSISLSVIYTKYNELRISVKDEGVGLRKEQLQEIFEPFAQLPDKKGISNPGLGIGLSLIKRLVELHGGRVWAQSKGLGYGSTFTVILPGVERLASENSTVRSTEIESKVVTFHQRDTGHKRGSVLLVDDNIPAAFGLSSLLLNTGYEVDVAHTGLSALEQIRKRSYDAILLDLGLPDIDGYEVASRLFADYPETPVKVIALTGFGQSEDKAKTKAAGFSYHLTKPVSITEVDTILSSIV